MYDEALRVAVASVYEDSDNIRVEGDPNARVTAVYFSSLALYEPTFESFRDRVVERDYYEFSRLRLARATRHVFVRDVMGLWYAKGGIRAHQYAGGLGEAHW